jgi:hypothetical protein
MYRTCGLVCQGLKLGAPGDNEPLLLAPVTEIIRQLRCLLGPHDPEERLPRAAQPVAELIQLGGVKAVDGP